MNKQRKKIIIGIQLFIALIFIVGADWTPEKIHQFFHNYFADIILPFGLYFLLMLIEDRFSFLRTWSGKVISVFLLASASEILQYFGIYALARVFDPIDFMMYASGVLLAALVDIKLVSRCYPEKYRTNRS